MGGRSNQPAIPSAIQCLETFLTKEFEALEGIEFEKKTVEKKRYLVERIKQYILSTYGNRHFQLSKLRLVDGTNLVNFCKKTFGHGHNHAVLHAEFLKRALNYAIANEWMDKNPLAFFRPRRERKPVVVLRESDIKKLEKAQFVSREYTYVTDVFLFCCYTGLSYTDVNTLVGSHISISTEGIALIRINRGKNGNPCIIPLVTKAVQLIQKYITNPDSIQRKTIFPVYSNQAMNRILKEIQAITGLEVRLTTHIARKTCASYYIAQGVPLTSVATMLGHVKTSTTEQYYTQRSEESVLRHFLEFQNKVSK